MFIGGNIIDHLPSKVRHRYYFRLSVPVCEQLSYSLPTLPSQTVHEYVHVQIPPIIRGNFSVARICNAANSPLYHPPSNTILFSQLFCEELPCLILLSYFIHLFFCELGHYII